MDRKPLFQARVDTTRLQIKLGYCIDPAYWSGTWKPDVLEEGKPETTLLNVYFASASEHGMCHEEEPFVSLMYKLAEPPDRRLSQTMQNLEKAFGKIEEPSRFTTIRVPFSKFAQAMQTAQANDEPMDLTNRSVYQMLMS